MRVAVLGGGHGCYAAAVEMSERGHDVWFWRRSREALRPVLEKGCIAVTDHRGRREVSIHRPTESLEEALSHAELAMWDIHNEGTQPAVRRVTDALDQERVSVREALGYGPPHFPLRDHYAKEGPEWMYGRAAHERLRTSGDWREQIDLVTHRYMLEDTKLGLSLLISVAKWARVETPVARGLLAIASAVVGENLYESGRTLEGLGLADLSHTRMRELLEEGV